MPTRTFLLAIVVLLAVTTARCIGSDSPAGTVTEATTTGAPTTTTTPTAPTSTVATPETTTDTPDDREPALRETTTPAPSPARSTTTGEPDSTESRSPTGTTSPTAQLNISNKTVVPGSEGTITVMGSGIGSMHPSPSTAGTPVGFEYGNASISPRIASVAKSYPPYWHWESTRSAVTLEIPFHVSADAPAETYTYSITGWSSTDHRGEGTTENFTIVVESNGTTQAANATKNSTSEVQRRVSLFRTSAKSPTNTTYPST